jgi:hypothetical protein
MSAPPPTAANLNLLEATFLLGIGQEGKLASGYEKYLRIAAILQMIIMGKVTVERNGENALLHVNEQPTTNGADPIGMPYPRENLPSQRSTFVQ